jgi:small subunit ribosomal protein S1
MTEPGNTSEQMEPTNSGTGELENSESQSNGTNQSPVADTTTGQSSAPAESTSISEAADPTADASTPQPEQSSDAGSTQPAAEAETSGDVPTAQPSTAQPSMTQPLDDAGSAAAEGSQPVAQGSEQGGEAPSEEAPSEIASEQVGEGAGEQEGGQPRKSSRSWQPPPMTEERMRELWEELSAKKGAGEEIELEVVSQNRGGVVTHYKNIEVFIPMSHWSLDRHGSDVVGDAKAGTKTPAHVLEMTEFDTDARRVTATRRSVLRKKLLESFEVGQRMSGRVSSILDFGVFVDLGGIDGLVHASEISHVRGRHPSELVKKGDEVDVVIREIDREKERIYLGMKELLPSPWDSVEEKYPEGTVQHGKVVGMTKLGAFIELEPGLDGFIRLRELSWTKRVHHPKEILRKGQEIDVKVLDVSSKKQRLSLSYRQGQEDPWPTIAEKYSVGTRWEGEIREISNKGVVVAVDDVEGFLPRGRMGRESKRLPEMKVGEKLPVNVIEVDPKGLSLIFGLQQPEREEEGRGGERGERRGGGRGDRDRRDGDRGGRSGGGTPANPTNEMKTSETVSSFTLGDILGDAIKKRLNIDAGEEATETSEGTSEQEGSQESSPATASASNIESSGAAAQTEEPQNSTEGSSENG